MRVRHPFARFSLPLVPAVAATIFALGFALGSLPTTALAQSAEPAEKAEAAPASPAVDTATPAAPEPALTAEPPAPAAVPPAPAPAPEKKPYFRKGVHRLRLNLGYNLGDNVRSAGILAAPLTGEPGQPNYPAGSALDVELDAGATFNIGYAYFFDEKWGIDLGLGYFPSNIYDKQFDLAEIDAQLATTTLAQDEKDNLRTRLIAHAQSHDIDITTFDVNATRIFAPRSKWPFELSAGLGWAGSSLGSTTIGDRVVYERLVTSTVVNPQDSPVVANDIPDVTNPYIEEGCLADNDPCIEMTEQGGLTWNIAATAHHPFTDKLMLDFGLRLRVTSQALDPGDEYLTPEFGIGLSFLFGGD